MKISHNEKTNGDGDDAKKFNMVVRTDSVREIVSDFLIEEHAGAARSKDDEADNKGAEIK